MLLSGARNGPLRKPRRHGCRSHIAESRQWLGGSPVMHRNRLTRDSLLRRCRNHPPPAPTRRTPTDPRPSASLTHLRGPPPAGLSSVKGPRRRPVGAASGLGRVLGNGSTDIPHQGGNHEDLPAVTVHGGRRPRAVRVAERHVHRCRELCLDARGRSTARAPSRPARRSTTPRAGSSRPTRSRHRQGPAAGQVRRRRRAHTQSFSKGYEVADNAPGAPQTVSIIKGLGTLTATCNDQNAAAGNEDPISVPHVPQPVRPRGQRRPPRRQRRRRDLRRRQPDRASLSIGGSNTFIFHVEYGGQNAIIQGGVRQDGRGTPAGTCAVFGVVTQVSLAAARRRSREHRAGCSPHPSTSPPRATTPPSVPASSRSPCAPRRLRGRRTSTASSRARAS